MQNKPLVLGIIILVVAASIGVGYYLATRGPEIVRGKGVEMLIFISPQYADNSAIRQAIDNYIAAVEADIGWETKVIELTPSTNTVGSIRQIIRQYLYSDGIWAAMMVGEDTATAFGGDYLNEESPSIIFWEELDEQIKGWGGLLISSDVGAEELDSLLSMPNAVFGGVHTPDVCISLVYPTAEWNYSAKAAYLASVFNKFSTDRRVDYGENILLFCDPNVLIEPGFGDNLSVLGNLQYCMDADESIRIQGVRNAHGKQFKLLGAFGHGSPYVADFLAIPDLEHIYTPVLIVGGCYTEGWYSIENTSLDDNRLSPSREGWWGEQIFLRPGLRVVIAGGPEHQQYLPDIKKYVKGFVRYAGNNLATGKTIAEAWLSYGPTYSSLIYGDPTFHY